MGGLAAAGSEEGEHLILAQTPARVNACNAALLRSAHGHATGTIHEPMQSLHSPTWVKLRPSSPRNKKNTKIVKSQPPAPPTSFGKLPWDRSRAQRKPPPCQASRLEANDPYPMLPKA